MIPVVCLKNVEVDLNEARKKQMEAAAEAALRDVAWMLESAGTTELASEMDGKKLVKLLRKNFSRLDPDRNGISKAELLAALTTPTGFTEDEYTMLTLLSQYFDMVMNLSDDEPGPETRITRADLRVLEAFLVHGQLTLAGLHRWLSASDKKAASEVDIGPPPLQSD